MEFRIANVDPSASVYAATTSRGGVVVADAMGNVYRRITPAYIKKKGGVLQALETLYRGSKIDRTYWLRIEQTA